MPRIARKNLKTSFLHVMVQGVNKEYIFYKNEYIEKYLKIITEIKLNYNFEILSYCIMNNHAHFLIYTENIVELGKFMHIVNLKYAQMYNRLENRCGVLFRNRYQIEPIYDLKHLINCIRYIHNNPVNANIVQNCKDYKYSSISDYINNVGCAQTKIMKEIFGDNCNYFDIFNNVFEMRCMDIEENNINKYIQSGINEFMYENKIRLDTIFSDRIALGELIRFLKNKRKIKYIEIGNYLNISKVIINSLKKIN